MKKLMLTTGICILVLSMIVSLGVQANAEQTMVRYRVEKGDTLTKIAGKQLSDGKLWTELLKYNNIDDPHWIHPGDIIIIPKEDVLRKLKNARNDEETCKIIRESKEENFPSGFDFRKKMIEGNIKCGNPRCTECYEKQANKPNGFYSGGFTCNISTYKNMSEEELAKAPLKIRELGDRLKFQPIPDSRR